MFVISIIKLNRIIVIQLPHVNELRNGFVSVQINIFTKELWEIVGSNGIIELNAVDLFLRKHQFTVEPTYGQRLYFFGMDERKTIGKRRGSRKPGSRSHS